MKRWTFAALLTAALGITAGCASLDDKQREWIFQPSDRAWGNSAAEAEGLQDVWHDLPARITGEKARMHALWITADQPAAQEGPALMSAVGQQPTAPRVLLSASAIGWYGDQGDTTLTEASPPGGKDFGSTLCMAWEQEAERASAHGVRVVRLRIAPVLAPKGGMLARLLPAFKLGLGGRLGSGQQWMPWIHLDDLVALFDHLLQRDDAQGAFNACAPEVVRNSDFTRTLGKVLRLALGEMSVLLLGGQHLQPQRTQASGFDWRYPRLEPALTALLR